MNANFSEIVNSVRRCENYLRNVKMVLLPLRKFFITTLSKVGIYLPRAKTTVEKSIFLPVHSYWTLQGVFQRCSRCLHKKCNGEAWWPNTPIQAITGSCMKARPEGQHGSKLQGFYKRGRHFASEIFFSS